jgi:YVTN family beta-propeller protein
VAELKPGDDFAGHRITGVAGRGGMGVVYRAVQLALDRPVALKLIAPELAEDPSFRERFVRESRLAAAIDHPNVIPIYYTGEHDGALYIAMRYVEGSDVRTLARAAGGLDPGRAARIAAQVASALDAAHERGIVHRDVKPANVLLGAGDHAYLTDFGLTKRIASHSGSTRTGGWVGTLGFVAPEQIRGERVDARADVYALGCLLFYMVAGSAPYARESDEAALWAHLNDDPPSLVAHAEGTPPALEAVVRRALAKDPDDRFPSAGDLGRAALAAVGHSPPARPERLVATGAAAPAEAETEASPDQAPTVPAERSAPAPPRRGARRPAWIWALAAVPVLALAVVAAIALSGGDGGPQTRTTPAGTTAAADGPPLAGALARTIEVGGRPNGVVASGGLLWVLRARSDRVTALRTPNGRRAGFRPEVGSLPAALATGFGRLWVVNQSQPALVAIGLRSHRRIGDPVALPSEGKVVGVAAGERGVWVGIRGDPGLIVRVSPSSRRIMAQVVMPDGVQDLAVGGGAVWVLGRRSNTVTRVDVATGEKRPVIVGADPAGVAVGENAVWVTNSGEDTVTRIDLGSLVTRKIGVGDGPYRVAVGGGTVWVANRNDSTLTRIDPETNRRVAEPVEVGSNPFALDVRGRQAWVTSPPDGTVQRVDF